MRTDEAGRLEELKKLELVGSLPSRNWAFDRVFIDISPSMESLRLCPRSLPCG